MSPDQDRDIAIRTMIGEAGDQGDAGMAGVGNVMLNRAQLGSAGGYADTLGGVALQPGQFEAWSRNGRGLMALSPQDPTYQRAAAIFDGLTSGQIGDNTKGATNFYAPAAQAALGRGAPSWGSSNVTAQIGGHVFSAPKGAVMRQQQADNGVDVDGLAAQWGASPKSSQGGASAASGATPTAANPGNTAGGQNSAPGGDVDVDGLASMWGGAKPADDHALTITRGPFGSLAGVDPAKIAADQGAPAAVPAGKVGDAGMAAGRGAIEGIPIAGPYLAAGLDRAIAAERSIHEDVPYSQALREVQDFGGATEAAHPYASTAGRIGGGVAAFGGLGATEAGAMALGLRGGNMLMRAGTGAATNGAIGAADAFVRSGGDQDATRTGGALGLTFGMAGPAVGDLAGLGGNALSQYIQDFRPQAAAGNALLNAVQGTGGDLPTMAQRLADNPRLSLMDVNPGAQDLAQGLAAQPGSARDTLVQAYGQRAGSAKDAVTGAYDAAMGPTPDVLATLDGIKATAASNAKAGFGAALANAKPVDTSAAIQALDAQIRPGVNGVVSPGSQIPLSPVQQRLQQIRGLLTTDDGSEVLTDPNRLHKIQSDLGVEGRTLLASSSGSDRLMGKAVMDARGNIVDAIDNATGGAFKPAQQQYASDMSVQDAFNKGLSIFQNRVGQNGLEDRPEYWRQFVTSASPAEKQALTLGVRTAADQSMSSVRNAALRGETIPMADANLDKLKAVLGDDAAGTLAQRMSDEKDIAATNAKLFQGSQTQPRQANKLMTAVRGIGPLSMEVGLPSFAAMTGNPMTAAALASGAVARRGFQVAGRAADTARNNALAQAITGSGPAAQDTVNRLMALAQQQGIPTVATGAGNALGATFQSLPIDAGRLQGQPVTSRQIRNRLLGAVGGG